MSCEQCAFRHQMAKIWSFPPRSVQTASVAFVLCRMLSVTRVTYYLDQEAAFAW